MRNSPLPNACDTVMLSLTTAPEYDQPLPQCTPPADPDLMQYVTTQKSKGSKDARIIVGCAPLMKDENLEYVLDFMEQTGRTLKDFFICRYYGEESKEFSFIMVQEHHNTTMGVHYHWAIQLPKKLAMSKKRFEAIQNKCIEIFGKHTYIAVGKDWPGIVKYYTKNVSPLGQSNGILHSNPKINLIDLRRPVQEHKANSLSIKNRRIAEAIKNKNLADVVFGENAVLDYLNVGKAT